MKGHVEIGHLTKYDAFRVNRDQVMDLEIWLKIPTNISNYHSIDFFPSFPLAESPPCDLQITAYK